MTDQKIKPDEDLKTRRYAWF